MKIAVTYENGQVFGHFGRTDSTITPRPNVTTIMAGKGMIAMTADTIAIQTATTGTNH